MTSSGRFSVRRLAAIDLTGKAPEPGRRAVLVRGEFALSTLVGSGLGGWLCAVGHPLLGIWSLGVGANYLALTLHALVFWHRPERLANELRGVDVAADLRRYSLPHLVLAVPFAVAIFAARDTIPRAGDERRMRQARCPTTSTVARGNRDDIRADPMSSKAAVVARLTARKGQEEQVLAVFDELWPQPGTELYVPAPRRARTADLLGLRAVRKRRRDRRARPQRRDAARAHEVRAAARSNRALPSHTAACEGARAVNTAASPPA